MTAQAGTIRTARQLRKSSKGNHVLVRTLLVVLQVMTSAVVFSFVFLFQGRISPLFLVFALLAATGLVAGLTSRRVLNTKIVLLQYLVGLISLIAGMVALNYFSNGVLGISYQTITQGNFELLEFIQVAIGIFTMWLAISAWRKPKNHEREDELPIVPQSVRPTPVQVGSNSSRAAGRVRTKRKINWFSSRPAASSNNSRNHSSHPAAQRERISLKSNQNSKRRVSKIRKRRSTLLLNRKEPVKFVGAEEHRCPYCLEPVVYNDPRGVEICPVCQTHHHADCWEVTGVCQVPHANG